MRRSYETMMKTGRSDTPMRRWAARALVSSALVVGACATDPGDGADRASFEGDPRFGEAQDTVCFSGRISGFYAVGERAVVLRRAPGETYLVATGFCPALDRVEAIALPESNRCLSRGDRLFISDTPFPDRADTDDPTNRCLVTGINAWDEAAAAQDEE